MNLIPKRNILSLSYIGITFLIFVIFWKLLLSKSGSAVLMDKELINCEDIVHLSVFSILSKGWTKIVYKGSWRNIPLAVKTINTHGYEMNLCKKTYSQCIASLQKNLAKEVTIFSFLDHPNIIKLYGSCLDPATLNDSASGAVFVELGQPLTSFSLVQKDYVSRIKLALELCSLLVYLGTFPAGAILVPDLRLQQFVLAGERLKLADVDSLQFGDKSCFQDSDCNVFEDDEFKKDIITVRCQGGKCDGMNDALNVRKSCQTILPYLLSLGAPGRFSTEVNKILECYKEASWSSKKLEASVQRIVKQYFALTNGDADRVS